MAEDKSKLNPLKSFWDSVRYIFYYLVMFLVAEILIVMFANESAMTKLPDLEWKHYKIFFRDDASDEIFKKTAIMAKVGRTYIDRLKESVEKREDNAISHMANTFLYSILKASEVKLRAQVVYVSLRLQALRVMFFPWGLIAVGVASTLSWKMKIILGEQQPGDKTPWYGKIHGYMLKKKNHPAFYAYVIFLIYLLLPFAMNPFYILIGAVAIFGAVPYIITGGLL
jgi:hypothetical protein